MITEVRIKNFKLFEEQSFTLDDVVLLAGPNNSGKTTLLQAIGAWFFGTQRWTQERGESAGAGKRTGIPITRKDFAVLPLREINLMWTGRQTAARGEGAKPGAPNLIEIAVKGKDGNDDWDWGMEFQYANPEMVYVRPLKAKTKQGSLAIPRSVNEIQIVHVPPFSGIATEEPKHERGYQNLLIGQGRPGELVRNLLLEISLNEEDWRTLTSVVREIFDIDLQKPLYSSAQPFILSEYRIKNQRPLDISNIGSGSLQVIMLMAFFYARPATVLLLDEPDAHLHIILQREVYDILKKVARERRCQLIISTHSEVLVDSTDPAHIVSIIRGKAKRLIKTYERDQLREAMKRLPNRELLLGDEVGAILYLEGDSDERILREWAKLLDHPAGRFLEYPFIHHLGGRNLKEAKDHFFALRAVYPGIKGICILDGDNKDEPDEEMIREGLKVLRWRRYEVENYLLIPEAIKRFVNAPLLDSIIDEGFWKQVPKETNLFGEHVSLMRTRAKAEFLGPLLESIGMPVPPKDFYLLAAKMEPNEINPEVREKLDAIAQLYGGILLRDTF